MVEENKKSTFDTVLMLGAFLLLLVLMYFSSEPEQKAIVAKKIHVEEKVCKDENQLNKEMYLKLSRATKKYCSANWFDGSEVCQHLETECFNYCIKTSEKNCRIECESRI